MKEKDFTSRFNKWLKYIWKKSSVFEIKITKGPSISFSRLEDHQKAALLNVKKSCLTFKIPDAGWQNPFDTFIVCDIPAYVVVFFYTALGTKHFYLIDIETWCAEEASSSRKSLTETRAKEIGTRFEL